MQRGEQRPGLPSLNSSVTAIMVGHLRRLQYLGSGQSIAHGADGFSIIIGFLFHLQKLSSLNERFQSLFGPTVH